MALEFRDARVIDAPHLAEICLCADGDTFDFLLHGLGSHLDVKDIMTALCRTETTAYSSGTKSIFSASRKGPLRFAEHA